MSDRASTLEYLHKYLVYLHKYRLRWQGTMDTMGEISRGLKALMTQDVGDQAWQQK